MVWGVQKKSCDATLERIEGNDPTLTSWTVLPTTSFGSDELDRITCCHNNTHLRELQASGHAVSAAAVRRLGQALASGRLLRLHRLTIGGARMGDDGLMAFCQGLDTVEDSKCELTHLDLSYKNITSVGLLALLLVLPRIKKLTHLDLSRNPRLLQQQPSANNLDLTMGVSVQMEWHEINLSGCDLSSDDGPGVVAMLRGLFGARAAVVTVGMTRTPWTLRLCHCPVSAEVLHFVLHDCVAGLQQLHLAGTTIASAINSMARAPHLQVLDWSDTDLTDAVLQEWIDILYANDYFSQLCSINLARTSLQDNTIVSLASAISSQRSSPDLELDLSGTQCRACGATMLLRSSRLSLLRLQGCPLLEEEKEDKSWTTLCRELRGGHMTLRTLDLAHIASMTETAMLQLLDALLQDVPKNATMMSTLELLVLGGNGASRAVHDKAQLVRQKFPALDIALDKLPRC